MIKKKRKIKVCFAKIWKPAGRDICSFEDKRLTKTWQVFQIGGRNFFLLLVDRFFTQKNKKSSGTTRV